MKKLALVLVALVVPAAALAANPTSVTIKSKQQSVLYNASATLYGKTTPADANAKVQILNRECGQSSFNPTPVASTQTTSTGSYRTTVHVLMKTAFQAKVKSTTSTAITVLVHPRMGLKELYTHRYRVRVWAAKSFAGKTAIFQRWSKSLGKWVRVRLVTLKFIKNGANAPTIISGASFTSKVAAGRRVRVILPAKQVAPCYVRGVSRTIIS
jgi:hypothetical protein